MPTCPPQTVFVILTGSVPPAGLARAAVRNGWPIHHTPPNRAQLEIALAAGHSSVVIIHVANPEEPALDLIHSLRSSRRCAVVIAIGSAATENSEIQARAAGAGLFLPASADADLIESTVRALIVQPPARSLASSPRPARARQSSAV